MKNAKFGDFEDQTMAKKQQTDAIAQIDAELATLRTREAQHLEQQRVANEALQAARTQREQQILAGDDDVDALSRAASDISTAEHRLRGVNDAVVIVSEKIRQLATKRADEIRWQERKRISARMSASVEAMNVAYAVFKPALQGLIDSMSDERQIFEVLQTIEHLQAQCGAILELQMAAITAELMQYSRGLLDPDALPGAFVGIGLAAPVEAQTPQPLGPSTGRQAHHGAEYPPKDQTPHNQWPLGKPPVTRGPPTREQILAQNRQALAANFPSIYGEEDTRTAEQIFADEQRRLQGGK
jgi:hypothetical protein